MAEDEEYRSRGEREYARCRIAEYSLLRIAGVSLRGRRWDGLRLSVTGQVEEAGWLVS
ncbi:hypothetical protein [Chlorobium limicola]|uniref:hypothetical protein n=1 Tax=Chlorobium limicola TaxID=1092 RepID=UPI000A7B9F2D|nr:hypothetical protein [Chlorobium limicola]